jgi:phosphoribosyl 1,2-cyclic phosphate phosphodiesterase
LSDCKSVSEDGLKLLRGVDTLIIGTPCRRAHPTHMSLAEGLELIADLQPKRAFITHLSHDFAHVETQKELPEDVYVAYDGLQLKWE